jgi:hypothetical protein
MSLLSELLRTVPRFVDRTRSQAELAASLAARLPCIGGILGGAGSDDRLDVPPGMHETVGVDVLSLLEEGPDGTLPAEPARTLDAAAEGPAELAATAAPAPVESDMPIQDYDSLAASQVVPRLATLSDADLRSVRSYEIAHRGRQTILNRISQRLGD